MKKTNSRIGKRNSAAGRSGRLLVAGALWAAGLAAVAPGSACADEGGISFWLPGQFGSLAAVPGVPGWTLSLFNYFPQVSASGAVAAAREVTLGKFSSTVNVNLNATISADPDLVFIVPSYIFATPVFGGQFAVSVASAVGRSTADLNGTLTLTGPGGGTITRQGNIDDGRTGFSDLYPMATLKWHDGVNNWMTYVTGDVPVGLYSTSSLANIGIGHGAIDSGVGYTYFNPQTGTEFSAVTGLTYNFLNPSTNYQNGIDWHLDWGTSHFFSRTFFAGAVGYIYDQLTADRGCLPALCPFESRVVGVGPQIGFIFPSPTVQTFLGFKSYWEFDAANRPSGWNGWVTLSFSPSPPAPESAAAAMVTKAPPR